MHVLMIGLDTAFLTQTITDSRARHEAYAERIGKISMVICNRRSKEPLPHYRSPLVTARPTESRSYLHYLSDGYRMALQVQNESPIDVVTAQDPLLTALIGLRLRRRFGIPLIIQVNASLVENRYYARERWHHRPLQRLARWTLRRADGVRVLNEGERQACLRRGVQPDRVCVAPIPSDVARFGTRATEDRLASWRTKLGTHADAPLAMWVGRPDPVKDLPTLLGAFARVHKQVPTARLVLVGNVDAPAIRSQISALGLSGVVRFTGAVTHADLPALYQIANVYMHSSYYEGLGLVMIEAAAAGLPVVSTATDGARDIVLDGETGILVPIGDADALATGVIDLFTRPERAKLMGERARQHVAQRFDRQNTISDWVGMWQSVAAGKKPCAPVESA